MTDRESLSRNLEWYIAHQDELVKEHDGKVLVIKDSALIGAYPTLAEAFFDACARFEQGTFSIQPCGPGPESYSITIASPWFCAA
jgi:hypothetical protein